MTTQGCLRTVARRHDQPNRSISDTMAFACGREPDWHRNTQFIGVDKGAITDRGRGFRQTSSVINVHWPRKPDIFHRRSDLFVLSGKTVLMDRCFRKACLTYEFCSKKNREFMKKVSVPVVSGSIFLVIAVSANHSCSNRMSVVKQDGQSRGEPRPVCLPRFEITCRRKMNLATFCFSSDAVC